MEVLRGTQWCGSFPEDPSSESHPIRTKMSCPPCHPGNAGVGGACAPKRGQRPGPGDAMAGGLRHMEAWGSDPGWSRCEAGENVT